ncbi:MAG TPA: hypothetical protein VHY22_04560 [Chthoniobacteraceae bacterium]|jgi:hypothetical protein|nr:hypothetical protein [Chthoniobacteraceae bacterium]
MNLRYEFNRLSHLFHNGVETSQQTASDWSEKPAIAARRAREKMDTGARSLVSAEEAMVRHVRRNPALYLIGAALIIGALIAKLLIEARDSRNAPLM